MAIPSQADIYLELTQKIHAKSRFDRMDNMIDKLTQTEYNAAIDAGLDYINSYAPVTALTMKDVYSGGKFLALKNLVVYAAIRELCFTLALDWLQSAEDSITIAEFTVSSKFQQYNDMYDKIGTMLDTTLEKSKKAYGGTTVRGRAFATDYSTRAVGRPYAGNLQLRIEKSMQGSSGANLI